MNKFIFIFIFILLSLCACSLDEENIPLESSVETETSADTDLENSPTAPAVITAVTYEKEAIDAYTQEPYGFTHTIEIPAIDSAQPGAVALNAKISEPLNTTIKALRENREEQYLYRISYSSSALDGVVFIAVQEDSGWQYSEWAHRTTYYYYDSIADTELTPQEYLAHFGLDAADLAANAALSYEYYANVGATELYNSDGNEMTDTLLATRYPAGKAAPEAYEITADAIHVYEHVTEAYVDYTFFVALDPITGIPLRPSYAMSAVPSFSHDADAITITFVNGVIETVIAPTDYSSLKAVGITSGSIILLSEESGDIPFPAFAVEIAVNGEPVELSGDSSGTVHSYRLPYYTPADLQTITITY